MVLSASKEGERKLKLMVTSLLCLATAAHAYTPGTDITQELQTACDDYSEPIKLPPGEFWLSDTIMLPTVSGFTLLGSGTQWPYPLAQKDKGTGTIIRWRGEDGPMFDFSAKEAEIGNFTLMGNGTNTGIRVTRRQAGIGSGKCRFRPLYLASLGRGIQCGRTIRENSCDNLLFEYVTFHNCKIGYHGVNSQGMDIVFDYLHAYYNVPRVFQFAGGGHLVVQAGLVTAPDSTFLEIEGTGAVGKNNGIFRINNVQIDAAAGLTCQMVNCKEDYPIIIVLDGVNRASKGWGWPTVPTAELLGRNLMAVTHCRGYHEIIGKADGAGRIPCVSITDSQLWGLRHNGIKLEEARVQNGAGNWSR